MNGTGDETKLGWTGRVCAALEARDPDLEITFYNLGIRRDTSKDIRRRFDQELSVRLQGDFDTLVVFSFGVNDTTMENGVLRVESARSIENARALLIEAAEQHSVLMVGPPPIADDGQNKRVHKLDAELAQLCSEISVPYLSVFDGLVCNPVWRDEVASNDGAHPHSAGYSLLSKRVLSWNVWEAFIA
ncbi:GDSL-type esterase/lipase family protein [Pontibacterium granulatum]|uniref:GDSL-type esterase/lipase family protein n=1 Tax=Pontibacterium granulatum TaxID=2036029 RepID=UPI00249CBC62|nr:GDSL-type esterase/lipase family protein [Pontibacterium granulatum]MDI3324089.1 GDSL-type esterase/lipase family protein [Pontibacterium granulatum]